MYKGLQQIPTQDTFNHFIHINILLGPHGCKEVKYDPDATKQSYFDKRFFETTVTCNTQDKISNLLHNMQGYQKQYRIQHIVAGKIHSSIGDTLNSVSTSLSIGDDRDKLQLLVIPPRKKLSKST